MFPNQIEKCAHMFKAKVVNKFVTWREFLWMALAPMWDSWRQGWTQTDRKGRGGGDTKGTIHFFHFKKVLNGPFQASFSLCSSFQQLIVRTFTINFVDDWYDRISGFGSDSIDNWATATALFFLKKLCTYVAKKSPNICVISEEHLLRITFLNCPIWSHCWCWKCPLVISYIWDNFIELCLKPVQIRQQLRIGWKVLVSMSAVSVGECKVGGRSCCFHRWHHKNSHSHLGTKICDELTQK